jgi:ribosomal protein S8
MTNFQLADLFVCIKVAYKARMSYVTVNKSKLIIKFLYLLYKIGIIKSFHILLKDNLILVYLKYKKNGLPLINSIDLVSKPSKRVYWNLTMLSKNYRAHSLASFYILSTSKGLLTSNEALLQYKISGEVICKIKI